MVWAVRRAVVRSPIADPMACVAWETRPMARGAPRRDHPTGRPRSARLLSIHTVWEYAGHMSNTYLSLPHAEARPRVHQCAPLDQRCAAPIGGLGLIADYMGERGLCYFTGEFGAVADPIAERRTEAVRRRDCSRMARDALR